MRTDISLLVAVGGGVLSFLSPCVLPLVPAYFASLAGPEVFERGARGFRSPVFLHAVLFVIGFAVIFVGLGALTGLVGFNVTSRLIVRKIAGGILIALGVFMLAATRIPWLNFEKRLTPRQGKSTGYVRSLSIGAIFAFAWTPCAGPVLGGVLTLAFDSATALKGAYLLAAYSLGIALPFLALAFAFDRLMPLFKALRRHATAVYIASGLLLIAAGVMTLNTWWIQPLLG
jgi:cytochrome c-type biogenesis protein